MCIRDSSTTVSSLNTTTTELDSKVETALSKAEQTSDKFSWLVKSGTSASDFSITDRLIALTSAALNINALTTFMNSAKNGSSTVIDGGSIKTDSITADQLRINSLDAIAALIGGFHIGKSSLYSGEKSSIANTSQGIYMDSSGQFNIGDGKNYFKYYKDTNDNYKLDVTAENIRFGATNENLKDVKEQITDLEETYDTRIKDLNTSLKVLNDAISMLVTDEKGTTLLEQTKDGWTFNFAEAIKKLNDTADNVGNLKGNQETIHHTLNELKGFADDANQTLAYVRIERDQNQVPFIELGKKDSNFRVKITNESVDFLDGETAVSYINNKTLYITRAIITDELQIGDGTAGGFIWKTRKNGNYGLRWKKEE